MASRNRDKCEVFQSFGACQFESRCKNSHEVQQSEQDYFNAVLTSYPDEVTSLRNLSDGTIQSFWIQPKPWFQKGARAGDAVEFCASTDEITIENLSYRRGRIVNIILPSIKDKQSRAMWENLSDCHFRRDVISVYTLKPPETCEYAYSVQECDQNHKGCKEIGIHVSCAALGAPFKVNAGKIPSHNSAKNWHCPHEMNDNFCLKKGKIKPALSVYVHTEVTTDELEIRLVKVKENFYHGRREEMKHFDTLWKHFVPNERSPEIMRDRNLPQYLVFSPKHWKQYFLVDRMMLSYNRVVATRASSISEFITKVWDEYPTTDLKQGTVAIFRDLFPDEQNAETNANAEIQKALVVGVKQKTARESVTSLLSNYCWTLDKPQANNDIACPCTSPMSNIRHFVNQQIVVHSLLGSTRDGYTRRELSGILVTRFETPRLQKTIVKKLESDAIHLEYFGLPNPPESVYQAPYSIFRESEAKKANDSESEKLEVLITGVPDTGVEYCNRDLVHTNLQALKECLRNGEKLNLGSSQAVVESSPYVRSGENTKLLIQAGVELQIQMSMADAQQSPSLTWRLLRISKDLHMCFTHLNNPNLAFMSERRDVREIVVKRSLLLPENWSSQRHEVTKRGIKIHWEDNYYSGGSFTIKGDRKEVDRDALLCIRKDDSRKYVWCCHAVVTEVKKRGKGTWKVEFEVCTLSQTETESGSDGFIVEIISQTSNAKEEDHA